MILHRVVSSLLLLLAGTTAVAGQVSLPLSADTVHWGHFSKTLNPSLTVDSGTEIDIELGSHHACDDYDKMIAGDSALEAVFGSMMNNMNNNLDDDVAKDSGDGIHMLTGPIFVNDAQPGDMLQVDILQLTPRPNAAGKTYGSNAAAWWGYQARVNKVDGTAFRARSATGSGTQDAATDEVITIYEIVTDETTMSYATPVYQYAWPVVTSPAGKTVDHVQSPACVAHTPHGTTASVSSAVADMGWSVAADEIRYTDSVLPVKIPVQYHVGVVGLAPASHDKVDSTPPMVTGGNLDNRRLGAGTTLYLPVQVAGAMLSLGDPHAAQGDSELNGSGVEVSLNAKIKVSLIKAADLTKAQQVQDFPLAETESEWIVHGFTETDYLATHADNPAAVFSNPSLDPAMKNVFTQSRKWLMAQYDLTEGEANTIITEGVDFAVTQLIAGNWGMHAVIPKAIFSASTTDSAVEPASHSGRERRLQKDADLPLSSDNVHWGYFSKDEAPVLEIESGQEIIVEMATHHGCDDYDLMIAGDDGMQDIFQWTGDLKNERFRGATGVGDGVHILTGPIFVKGAEPGDIIKVDILDLEPRVNPEGKTYGSNAAAWWGFQARVNKVDGTKFLSGSFTGTPDQNDEMITIYEIVSQDGLDYAMPKYQFEWVDITDPMGEKRDYIAYPGTCVPHDPHGDFVPSSHVADAGWIKHANITYYDNLFPAKIPVNYHVGCMGLAPASHSIVDSIPPMPTGGNLDNKRIGVGTTMYYPVEVAGGLLSMGDAHAAQADSELDGTGVETSITGKFRVTVIKPDDHTGGLKDLDFPLGETEDSWIVHGFTATDYLDTFSGNPGDIYGASNLDDTMKNGFTQTRKFIMAQYGLTEAEAWSFITQATNFGITQLVDGNWGVHAIIPKSMFVGAERKEDGSGADTTSASFSMVAAILGGAASLLWFF